MGMIILLRQEIKGYLYRDTEQPVTKGLQILIGDPQLKSCVLTLLSSVIFTSWQVLPIDAGTFMSFDI